MKHLFKSFIFTICLMFVAVPGFALDFSFGVEVENVLERDMKFSGGSWKEAVYPGGSDYSSSGDIEDDELPGCNFESNRVLLDIGIGLHPRVDLFLKLGTADADVSMSNVSGDIEFDGDFGSALGVGLEVRVFEVAKFNFVAVAKYLQYTVDNETNIDGEEYSSIIYNPGDSHTYSSESDVREWEVNLLVNRAFGWFVPYIGVSYSDSNVEVSLDEKYLYWDGLLVVSNVDFEWEQKDNVGIIIGADAELGKNFSANLGGKIGSEKSVSFEVLYRF